MQLECFCKGCLPVTKSYWKFNNFKVSKGVINIIDEKNDVFKTVLKIEKANNKNEGTYECQIENKEGKGNHKVEVTVKSVSWTEWLKCGKSWTCISGVTSGSYNTVKNKVTGLFS